MQGHIKVGEFCRRWSSKPSGKCSYERPTRSTVCGTMCSMCGADAGCLAIKYQSLRGVDLELEEEEDVLRLDLRRVGQPEGLAL